MRTRSSIMLFGVVVLLAAAVAAQELTPSMAKVARQHYKDGVGLMSSEKWDEAVEQFNKALAIDPRMALAHYNIGQSRMAQKRFAEAVSAYRASRDAFEQLGTLNKQERDERERMRRDEINELRNDIQRISQTQGGRASSQMVINGMEERLRLLESTQYRDRENETRVPAEVYLALGSAYFRQQKLDDAEREYRLAITANPKLGEAHNNLAVVLFLTKRLDEAKTEMELAKKARFKVNPQFEEDLKNALEANKGTK
jgi:tetratricopeptide (TPR) repeat protein